MKLIRSRFLQTLRGSLDFSFPLSLALHAAQAGKTQQLASPDQMLQRLVRSDCDHIRQANTAEEHQVTMLAKRWLAQNPGHLPLHGAPYHASGGNNVALPA